MGGRAARNEREFAGGGGVQRYCSVLRKQPASPQHLSTGKVGVVFCPFSWQLSIT